MRTRSKLLLALLLVHAVAAADHYARFDIIGVPDNAGPWTWPVDAPYSWLSHRFPAATIWHSWRLHPGSDGGFRFGTAQAAGELTSVFLMFNVPTAIYSIGNGVTIDSAETINMDKLRKISGNTIADLGSGAGVDPLVPPVADITALAPGQNGWQINTDGTYHLIYNTAGTCQGCEMVLHFYGTALPVAADGDITGDGSVDSADILVGLRLLLGLDTPTMAQLLHGDVAPLVNGTPAPDSQITAGDILVILRKISGLAAFP